MKLQRVSFYVFIRLMPFRLLILDKLLQGCFELEFLELFWRECFVKQSVASFQYTVTPLPLKAILIT